jgi:hypothetical protein
MNRDDDFIALLEDYLDTYDGVVALPEHVRSNVQARLPATQQVGGRSLAERIRDPFAGRSAPIRLGIGVAAAFVIVAGAASFFTGRMAPGVAAIPSAAPSPTPAPSTSHASSPSRIQGAPRVSCGDDPGMDCVAAGTYAVGSAAWPGTIMLDIPAGWFAWDPADDFQALLVDAGADVPDGSGWGVAFSVVDAVSKDPCDASAGTSAHDTTGSAAGFVDAMRAWPGFNVSAATQIKVDGNPGLLVEVTSSRTAADCEEQVAWTTPSGYAVDAYPMVGAPGHPRAGTFRVVEVADAVIVIRTTEFGDASPHELTAGVTPDPLRHAADLAELRTILESIRVGTVAAR